MPCPRVTTVLASSGIVLTEFPGDSVVKNPPANAGEVDLTPGLERSPGVGSGNILQYSCPGSPWTEGPGGLQSVDRRAGGLQSVGSQSRTRLGD